MGIVESLETSIGSLDLGEADQAIVDLAREYAEQIDAGETPDRHPLPLYGPKLLACLDSLLLTPKARRAITKDPKRDPADSPLDELKRRRAARSRVD